MLLSARCTPSRPSYCFGSLSVVLKTVINAKYLCVLSIFTAVILIRGNDYLLCPINSVRKLEFTCKFTHKSLVPAKLFFGAKSGTGANYLPPMVLLVIEPHRKYYCVVLIQTFSK